MKRATIKTRDMLRVMFGLLVLFMVIEWLIYSGILQID